MRRRRLAVGDVMRSADAAPGWVAMVCGYANDEAFGTALWPPSWRGLNAPMPLPAVPVDAAFLVAPDALVDAWATGEPF